MNIKPDFERFRQALSHKETDRVPLAEVGIGYGIQSQFLGYEVRSEDTAAQIRFWEKAGYDYIPIIVSLITGGKITEESKITRILKQMVLDKNPEETDPKAWNLEYTSFIHEREDFNKFPWDSASAIDYTMLEEASDLLPEGMKVIAISGKIFTLTWLLMGFQNFSLKLLLEPDLVADVFAKVAEIQFSALDTILSKDYVGGIWLIDDLAFGTGPMISPQAFRKYLFPWYRKIATRCHEAGRLVIMHSDGDLISLLPDLIDIGVDLIHPMDPTCVDIFKVKKEFGGKISLAGNVPNEMLQNGTVAEIEEYTKKLIKGCAAGGGYVLGSGNSVPDWSKFENYLAMRNTCLENGSYPIKIK